MAQSLSKPGTTGQGIYTGICSGCTSFDANQSTLTVPSGSTVTTMSGYGSYINNQNGTGTPNSGNSVNYFSVATCGVNSAACWGQNNVLIDNTTYATSTITGVQLNGIEIDFDVTSPHTNVQGPTITGSSLVQPAAAVGFTVGSLSVQNPSIAKWTYGFVTQDGVANVAAHWGALAASGSNVASQPVVYDYYDGAGAVRAWTEQVAANGSLNFTDSGSGHAVQVNSGFIAKAPSGNGSITVDNAGGQQSVVLLNDNGANKWQVGKDLSGNFFVYDTVANAYVMQMPSGGVLTVSPLVAHAKSEIDSGYQYTTPASGSTLTMGATQETELIHGSGTIASLTLTLPACSTDGQIARFASDVAVTSLTVNAPFGTVTGAPNTIAANAGHAYVCRASATNWFPLY
ncbi:hypothetical protein [Burkholderia sp. LMG 21824]|uniref:hypothetical protein n=1 Tax=Burkholderia sp. LMG 21824 TaxID=3158172 RepID=UPI003C2FA082